MCGLKSKNVATTVSPIYGAMIGVEIVCASEICSGEVFYKPVGEIFLNKNPKFLISFQ